MYRVNRSPHTFDAFAENDLRDYLAQQKADIAEQIKLLHADYVLNVNETEYVEHLVSRYTIDVPVVDFDHPEVSDREADIPAERFPTGFSVRPGKSYTRQVVTYHLPLTGDGSLLRYQPSTHLMWSTDIYIADQAVCFDIVNMSNSSEDVQRHAKEIVGNLRTSAEYLRNDLEAYNSGLQSLVGEAFKARKAAILHQRNTLASLGVPVKKRDNVPQTYAIPAPQVRKSVKPQPQASPGPFAPEPTLDETTYRDILRTIHEVGKGFERYPSTSRGKGEEDLRDYLIMFLEPQYEGSTTGETFNKAGKTDILIRHEGTNVFIAECKFWHGPKGFLETISQLLSYLTWRDSKAAVIIFVRNKDFSSVLQAAKETAPKHPNFLSHTRDVDETWVEYRFHLNDDPGREVKVAVMLFHLPGDEQSTPTK